MTSPDPARIDFPQTHQLAPVAFDVPRMLDVTHARGTCDACDLTRDMNATLAQENCYLKSPCSLDSRPVKRHTVRNVVLMVLAVVAVMVLCCLIAGDK